MNKKLLLGGVVILALVSVFLAFNKPAPTTPNTVVGALSGPDIPYNYLCVGGVCHYYATKTLGAATTTPCSMQSPTSTSTLVATTFNVTTASSTATYVDVSTSTTAFASTTVLMGTTIVATGQRTISYIASTTGASGGAGGAVFAPSTWIVWKVSSASGGAAQTLGGSCQAEWRAVPR
jgi:hypothetical protein